MRTVTSCPDETDEDREISKRILVRNVARAQVVFQKLTASLQRKVFPLPTVFENLLIISATVPHQENDIITARENKSAMAAKRAQEEEEETELRKQNQAALEARAEAARKKVLLLSCFRARFCCCYLLSVTFSSHQQAMPSSGQLPAWKAKQLEEKLAQDRKQDEEKEKKRQKERQIKITLEEKKIAIDAEKLASSASAALGEGDIDAAQDYYNIALLILPPAPEYNETRAGWEEARDRAKEVPPSLSPLPPPLLSLARSH